ncbi:MAG: hypothetical protein E3K32_13405 [wastewater metagenome]|nr:hypothetical protein [Candidatus Loosdrechtia aerotolerans]
MKKPEKLLQEWYVKRKIMYTTIKLKRSGIEGMKTIDTNRPDLIIFGLDIKIFRIVLTTTKV